MQKYDNLRAAYSKVYMKLQKARDKNAKLTAKMAELEQAGQGGVAGEQQTMADQWEAVWEGCVCLGALTQRTRRIRRGPAERRGARGSASWAVGERRAGRC